MFRTLDKKVLLMFPVGSAGVNLLALLFVRASEMSMIFVLGLFAAVIIALPMALLALIIRNKRISTLLLIGSANISFYAGVGAVLGLVLPLISG